jgi:hypothetical protein
MIKKSLLLLFFMVCISTNHSVYGAFCGCGGGGSTNDALVQQCYADRTENYNICLDTSYECNQENYDLFQSNYRKCSAIIDPQERGYCEFYDAYELFITNQNICTWDLKECDDLKEFIFDQCMLHAC